jgi:hypothetical protein
METKSLHSTSRRVRPLEGATLLVTLLLTAACASTGGRGSAQDPVDEVSVIEPYDAAVYQRKPETIGSILMELDLSMGDWNHLILTARNSADRRRVSLLEKDIMRRVHLHLDKLVMQLETGPNTNRIVAAMALGFSRDRAVLSPLLSALEDPVQDVVNNALLGIALLGQPDTPLAGVALLLRAAPQATTRHNAAYAILHCLTNGSDASAVLDAVRLGLADEHPGVRAQCALALAAAGDADSLDDLVARLDDDVALPAGAAARALGNLAHADNHIMGKVARALASSLARAEPALRAGLLRELARLAGVHLGEEADAWVQWAHRLP